MITATNEFWDILAASHLLSPQRLAAVAAEFSTPSPPQSAAAVAEALTERKLISSYQAKILLAGHAGPFQYGNYIVSDQLDSETSNPVFRARHRSTRHPVLLEFFAGAKPSDLVRWQRIESVVEKSTDINSPHFVCLYESVVTPNYRFVVSSRPVGIRLSDQLPYKARMPWKNACLVFAQVAAALELIHRQGSTHGAITPRTIWMAKNGLTQLQLSLQPDPDFETDDTWVEGRESRFHYLAPDWSPQAPISAAMDVYALGCSLVRAITGRPLFEASSVEEVRRLHREKTIQDFAKYDLPLDLKKWIQKLLAKNPKQRPLELGSISKSLEKLSGKSLASFPSAEQKTLAAYRQTIDQFKPGQTKTIESVPTIITGNAESQTEFPNFAPNVGAKTGFGDMPKNQIERSTEVRKNTWLVPASIAAGLALLAVAIGAWALNLADQTTPAGNLAHRTRGGNASDVSTEPNTKPRDPLTQKQFEIAAMSASQRPIVLQQLVDDDRESLWETPTTGPPVELLGLPSAPKMIFIFRPAEITATAEGRRLIRSLGPEFAKMIERWQTHAGLELSQMKQVIVSLHTNKNFTYDPFFIVVTDTPLDIDRALQIWNRPQAAETDAGKRYFVSKNSDLAYCFLPELTENMQPVDTTASDSVSRFAFASQPLVAEVANHSGTSLLPTSLTTIADLTDQNRHVNLLFLRTALFNDEGQQLMGPRLRNLNRELSVLIPDSVRGGLISLHLDTGTYFEMILDGNLDLDANELKNELSQQMRTQRDRLTQFVATIPPSQYWDKIRLKYDNMLTDFFRNLRWGVEYQEVVANAWLPPMAAHNLLAASELVVAFSAGAQKNTTTVAKTSVPQTIEELLRTKRDLNIANPPDLNLLIAEIEAEVNEDNPGLPFKFRIRLLGSDLQSEGITKNQRPAPLKIEQKSLAEILTQIMTSANPSKDISGPDDPNCKLVWVVSEDPQSPDNRTILITTRAAAERKSYELPPAFQIQ